MEVALSSPVLVGRDDLLALADRRLAAAAGGAGELLFLAGEAGIGKTRLLAEIVRRALAGGFTVAGAGASPGDHEVAAGLLGDLAAEMRRRPGAAETGGHLAARLHGVGDGDPARQRRLLVTDLADLIERLARRPTLITLEDLHWADELTLDVLGRLGRRAPGLPLLLIGTYRSDELYPRVPMRAWRTRLLTQRHAEEVRLTRLSRAGTAAMAAAIARADLPGTVTGAVFERSDGIPLHVEEFLATLGSVPDTLADAVLARADQLGGPARSLAAVASVLGRSFDLDLLTAITGEGPATVDDGLRELTERFFVRPRPDRSGYDFRHALIREALYADLAPHRRRDLHAKAAAAAVSAGFSDAFVSDQYERAALFPQAHRHALAAAEAAATMSAHREAAGLYQRVLRTCPPEKPDRERADLLAALAAELAAVDDNTGADASYAQAYRLRLALDDRVGAAELVPAWVAVRHLLGAGLDERTAALRGALPLIAFRDDDRAKEARANIHAALAAAYMLDRRLAEAIEDGELAQSIAVEDCDRAMRCHLDATLGSVFLFAGRIDEGLALLEGSITRAAGWGFDGQTARGYRMLGSSASVLVEYDLAERWLTEGIAFAERVEQFNDRHYMAAHLAHVRWATGDWAGAETQARRALADGGGITTRITALHVLGFVALGRGDLPAAAGRLLEAEALGAGMRELQRVSPAWWGLAEVALRSGDPAAAIERCEQGYAASARVRDAAYLYPYVVTGTRAQLAAAGPGAARDWVARVSEPLRERAIPGTLGAIDHARGLIHLHEGQTGKAREALAAAGRFWAARRRFWEGTEVLADQARCATRSRRPGDAAIFTAAARDAYTAAGAPAPGDPMPGHAVPEQVVPGQVVPGQVVSGHAVPGQVVPGQVVSGRVVPGRVVSGQVVPGMGAPGQAGLGIAVPGAAVAGRAGSRGPDRSVVPAPTLSAREVEVARLVATGLTNREIAVALTIAPKTAAAHVEHIRTKLGFSRRAQIAAWVAAQSRPMD